MTLAIGRLVGVSTGVDLGTAFAVTDRLALTAFHCVGDRHTAQVTTRRVRCIWEEGETLAVVHDGEPEHDVALLRLERRLPPDLESVRLTRSVAKQTPFTAPGNVAAVPEVRRFTATGDIAWPDARLEDGSPVLQLTCEQSMARLPLHGLSGAPVLVGDARTAAGVVRRNPQDRDHPHLAAGATVFATPASAVLDRWPQLASASHSGRSDLTALLRRLAKRSHTRDAATARRDIEHLLLVGDLGVDEGETRSTQIPETESERIEIARGRTVIDVCSDLRVEGAVRSGEARLDICLARRFQQTGKHYAGVLTDGAEWRLYHQIGDRLRYADSVTVSGSGTGRKADELPYWLESLLAVRSGLPPSPKEIETKLGATSPSYALDAAELADLYQRHQDHPEVRVKRAMWAKLLTTASGANFGDDDELFVDHTLLVAMAKVIGHAVLGFRLDEASHDARTIMRGKLLTAHSSIGGVVEADFFDWVADVPGGERFIDSLVRRLTRFDWDRVVHDTLKVLYESIIPEQVRHSLGEYYTPDWLAEAVIAECVTEPLSQKVLDASCGSGTFLFHAVRRYITAAEAGGASVPEIIRGVRDHVLGFDVHPVAVTLARVTYLLAIGPARLQAADRPEFVVPVYLADALPWGEETDAFTHEGLSVPAVLDRETFLSDPNLVQAPESSQLTFPESVVADADRFDRLVTELAAKASQRPAGGPRPSITGLLTRFHVRGQDRVVVEQTFANMCMLHDQGKDHIWGYFVRNQARPNWLSREDNRIDVLIGNPPWLAYHHMTPPQQAAFRRMCTDRGLWAGASLATSQDLSALFVARCVERYLREGGSFGYVMPRGAIFQRQYSGFRTGSFGPPAAEVKVEFDRPWDLQGIKKRFFRQSAGVVLGWRAGQGRSASALDRTPEVWSGTFDTKRASWAQVEEHISRAIGEAAQVSSAPPSPYGSWFINGATAYPRALFFVVPDYQGPLGPGARRRAVRGFCSPSENRRWKQAPKLSGSVEEDFIHQMLHGGSLLPFRCADAAHAVIPWDGERLLHGGDETLDHHPGLADWWRRAEAVWEQYRSSPRMTLTDQLDYNGKLSRQFPVPPLRVIYNKSGMYLAAAIVSDSDALVDHKLYWAPVDNLAEARFLTALFNSEYVTHTVRHLQARGEHNPRDYDKHIFKLPIPLYDVGDERHRALVDLAERAERVAAAVELPNVRFERQRGVIREALVEDGVATEIDAIVKPLLQ
jgi:hypothetical protein